MTDGADDFRQAALGLDREGEPIAQIRETRPPPGSMPAFSGQIVKDAQWVLPVSEREVLQELYTRRRECNDNIQAVEARGDMQASGKLRLRLREIKSLIEETGGIFDA